MKRSYRISLVILILFSINHALACMPHTPKDVIIARFQSSTASLDNRPNFNIVLTGEKFIFRSGFDLFRYTQAKKWQSSFPIEQVLSDQVIIGLVYAPDGHRSNIYQIVSFATISCNNDQLIISKPKTPFLAWDRQSSLCTFSDGKNIGILDGFMEYDQKYYLAKIQAKYASCKAFAQAFPHSNSEKKTGEPPFSLFKIYWKKIMQWLSFWS